MRVARGEIKKIRATSSDSLGVADGTRTRDVLDHNQVLYQLNYSHHRALASNGLTVAVLRRRGKFRSPLPLLNTSRPPHPSFHSRHHPTASPFPFYASRARLPHTIAFSRKRTPHCTLRLAKHSTQHHTCAARHMHHTNTWGQPPRSCPHIHISVQITKKRAPQWHLQSSPALPESHPSTGRHPPATPPSRGRILHCRAPRPHG